jgi:cell division septation protein DedD
MKNNETGEFELVVGNKQLLSGFFVVVVLFAVFFVMGYIVGRNSTPATQAATGQAGAGAPAGGRPQPASGTVPAPQSAPSASEQPKDDAGGNPPANEPPTTQPAQQAETKPAPPAPTAVAPAPVEPAPGEIYLQVTSVKGQDVAETVAKTLKDKGFPAIVSPGLMGQTRVLVGPYADRAKLGQAKAELEHLGFAPFVKR